MAFGTLVQDIIFRIQTVFVGPKDVLGKFADQITKAKGGVKGFATMLDATKPKMSAFRFDMLSLMFMGQMVQRMLNSLLQPAFDAVGVFDVWSTLLEIFFLPIAMVLLDVLLWLLDVFTAIPEPIQLVIGAFVLIGSIIAGVIGFLAAMGVGISSIFGGFAPFVAWLGGIAGAVGGVLTAIASLPAWVIAAIIALLVAIIFNWQGFVAAFTNLGTNLFNSIVQQFDGLISFFEGLWDVLVGLWTGNTTLISDGVKKMVDGILNYFVGLTKMLIGNFMRFGYDLVVAFATGIMNAGGFIVDALKGLPIIGPYIASAGSMAGGFASAVGAAVGGLAGWGGLIPGFQHGGIVTSPTLAMIGEAGPEAIVPVGAGLGTSYFNNQIVINANVASGIDISDLADEINDRLATEYTRRQMVRMRQL